MRKVMTEHLIGGDLKMLEVTFIWARQASAGLSAPSRHQGQTIQGARHE
jgi:hypothetical protein